MAAGSTNDRPHAPTAIEADGLSKHFQLGEHRSLRLTLRRLTTRSGTQEAPFEALSGVDLARPDRGRASGSWEITAQGSQPCCS